MANNNIVFPRKNFNKTENLKNIFTQENVKRNKAVYLKSEMKNGRFMNLYNKNELSKWVNRGGKSYKTGKPITRNNIKSIAPRMHNILTGRAKMTPNLNKLRPPKPKRPSTHPLYKLREELGFENIWRGDDYIKWRGVEFGANNSIRRLDLRGKQLTKLPSSIGNLTGLTELYLSDNKLTSLPSSIGNLSRLKTLLLENNKLKALPPSIGNLRQLTGLYLINNQLTKLPSSIGNLRQLTTLYLKNNQLTELPSSIGNLTKLELLFLENNKLKVLPPSLEKLTELLHLGLSGNPFKNLSENNINTTIVKNLLKLQANRQAARNVR